MKLQNFFAAMALFVAVGAAHGQCDPTAVDFGGEPWGLAPDGLESFFESAYVGVEYLDEVHLLVPSLASEVVPDTPLDVPIDSVVIEMVLLVDTVSGDTLFFEEAGLEYACNNLGDCVDPCTFLGGEQYCATFTGIPTVSGNYVLSLEVNVWGTIFGFPLATPFSFDGFPFPILDGAVDGIEESSGKIWTAFPNPASDAVQVNGASGSVACLRSLDGRLLRRWSLQMDQETLDVADCPNGVYILSIEGGENASSSRLIVQH